jgi:hypothetical protein
MEELHCAYFVDRQARFSKLAAYENDSITSSRHISLICFWLLPEVEAVSPPPDGGYPGCNTAEGQNALLSLTTGTYNTAVGVFSLQSSLTGDFNTTTGAGALLSNTTGDANTANGYHAGFNISGSGNVCGYPCGSWGKQYHLDPQCEHAVSEF